MKKTKKSTNGTSYFGSNFVATVKQLKEICGDPVYSGNTGEDKTNFEWEMELDNGEVFTIYDWKEYMPIHEDANIEWHIGGKNSSITLEAKNHILKLLPQFVPLTKKEIFFGVDKNKKMEYKIATSHTATGLQKEVKMLIEDGFTPIGSHIVSVIHSQNRFRGTQHIDTLNEFEYSQTMIKK